ncbi:FtsX-like permease family protein [Nocardioides sp. URHA0020]|uniref:FtsX-like permease family protein n=1 Tax=Nocardioides sp. URHA0020 TaxID=1380392 RepID=UPI00048AEA6B|nr:FtsX-like permease family protein [Nocardioides sp. URHA0020]
MRPLALTIVLAAGRGRAALVVGTTAVTSGLLLVAISIARLPGYDYANASGYSYSNQDRLLAPLADPGTRPGAVLAVILLIVPVLLLLDQAVRLGSAGQHRRYTALAVAGATRRDLRGWAATEIGGPALAGATLGIGVWWLLRELLGRQLSEHSAALVPTSVGPGPWTILVVVAVAAYGALVGRRAGSRATADIERGRDRPPPRPWPALLLVAGCLVLSGRLGIEVTDLAAILAAVVFFVAGAIGLAPWAAYRAGGLAARHARSARMLLAARRLQADPRPAGRAAAAVGAVALAAGVLGVFVVDIATAGDYGDVEEYLVPAAIVGVCALLAAAMIAVSIAVHSVETTLERRREMAALVATGVPVATVGDAQRIEGFLTTLPLTVAGSVVGALGYGFLIAASGIAFAGGLLATLVNVLVVAFLVWLANVLVRPWLDAAVEPGNLRTE